MPRGVHHPRCGWRSGFASAGRTFFFNITDFGPTSSRDGQKHTDESWSSEIFRIGLRPKMIFTICLILKNYDVLFKFPWNQRRSWDANLDSFCSYTFLAIFPSISDFYSFFLVFLRGFISRNPGLTSTYPAQPPRPVFSGKAGATVAQLKQVKNLDSYAY